MLKFNTPKDIDNYEIDQILDLIKDDDSRIKVPVKNRLAVIKTIYRALNLDLTPDLLLALLDEGQAELIVATAGSGKTTNAQIKILLDKMFRVDSKGNKIDGTRVLCLVYNNSNVEPMKDKHKALIAQLHQAGVTGFDIDSDVNAKTMHSFCLEWRKQYSVKLELDGFKLLSDTQIANKLSANVKILSEIYKFKPEAVNISDLAQLYNLVKECLLPYSEMDKTDKFAELKLDKEIITKVFELYDTNKKRTRSYDFTDMLVKIYELLSTDEEARLFVQNYYQYIVADEVQDFTPIMLEILRLISGNVTPVICIGDEDQCIYGFKGSDINTVLHFNESFPNGKVYSLGVNRRCGEKIVNASKYLVEHNTLRFPKIISAARKGGVIKYEPYVNADRQLEKIVDHLTHLTENELDETMIGYRDKVSSLKLSYMLDKANIPYYVLSGYNSLSHELYKHIIDVLNIIYYPLDNEYLANLYKCTPLTREDVKKVLNNLEFERKNGKIKQDYIHFLDIDYGIKSKNANFLNAMADLQEIADKIEKEPLCNYFPKLFNLIKTYFWNWKKQINKTLEVDNFFEDKIIKEFNCNKYYDDFEAEYSKRKNVMERNQASKNGVALSTFHKMKGLEYKDVYIIDLEDGLFPNYEKIEKQKYSSDKELKLKESEVRLFFVAMTRARDNLTLCYNQGHPSLYVQWLLAWEEEQKKIEMNKPVENINAFVNANAGLGLEDFSVDNADEELLIEDDDLSEVNTATIENTTSIAPHTIEDKDDTEELKEEKDPPSPESFTASDFLSSVLDIL